MFKLYMFKLYSWSLLCPLLEERLLYALPYHHASDRPYESLTLNV